MAVWLQVARQSLRPASRLSTAWRARIAFGALYAFVTFWAAAAPQAGLSLGERLRLSFNALLFVSLVLAATSRLRRSGGILDDDGITLGGWNRFLARIVATVAKSAQDLIPALPFLVLLTALHIISTAELIFTLALVASVLVVACAISNVKLTVVFILTVVVLFFTWRRNAFEKTICALLAFHLAVKAFVLWTAIQRTHRRRANLMHEAITALESAEFAAIHRTKLRRQFAPAIIALACVNFLLVSALALGVHVPATFEQKVALAFALAGGAALLFLDASALAWRGLLSGVTTTNIHQSFAALFAVIIGIPWAAAWIFSALHSGEAMTLNEAAAYFFLWIALGAAISWFARVTAKEKMQRDLRRLLSEP